MPSRMTPEEAISYIENYGWSTTRLGLSRTKALLDALGNPQRELKFIHVAGSNGKGSTCSMLAEIMKKAGYKTGLYISPYIEVFNERIQINGEYIPGERLAQITERVKTIADSMEDHPSQFELVTAIAIQYYYEEKCDIVILEVGMGGALDSTNAIDSPEVAVITNIGLEHTEYLGSTLEEIAYTKGGIIKEGCSCVCYDSAPEVINTISKICNEKEVAITIVDSSMIKPIHSDLDGQRFIYSTGAKDFSSYYYSNDNNLNDNDFDENNSNKNNSNKNYSNVNYSDDNYLIDNNSNETIPKEYNLSLLGEHQIHNAAVVLETVNALRTRGWDIPNEAIQIALEEVKWPARFEVLSKNPVFILDGGHNPQCAEALVESIKEYLPNQRVIFLLGVLADKDYDSIIDMMMPFAEEFICVTPLSDRALPGRELSEFINNKGGKATWVETIKDGIITSYEAAERKDKAVIAFGSLYLAGAVRAAFKSIIGSLR